MLCKEYHEKFQSLNQSHLSCGGLIGNKEGLIKKELIAVGTDMQSASSVEKVDARLGVRKAYVACLFLQNSNETRFSWSDTRFAQ